MKKALTASVLLNLVLTVCLMALLKQRTPEPSPAASDLAPAESPEAEIASNRLSPTISNDPVDEQPAPSQFSPSAETPSRRQLRERPAVLPLVFQEVDPTQLNLNRDQLQAIDDLRQTFVDQIGGLEQNPTHPAYRERWLKSQPQIDDDLRGMIGVTAFQNYQIEAVNLAEKRENVK
jgi:hypothetical protein